MAEKDISEKILEDHADVFADIVNGFCFQGREVVKPDELEPMNLRSAYRAEAELHDVERDVAKRWKKNGIRIACVGFENQTTADPDMVLRVYGYDGAEYRAQCLKENEAKPRYPVVTLVLYFGYKQRWTEAKSLYEAVDVPDVFKPFVSDVKLNVFEVAWLSDEQVKRFKSDFRIVADYFVQKRKTGAYEGSLDEIHHFYEVLQLLKVMEHDDRYEKVYYDLTAKGGRRNMCDVIDRYINMGEEKGKALGRQETLKEVINNLRAYGNTDEKIADMLKLSFSQVQQVPRT